MPPAPLKKDSPLTKYAYYSNLVIEMGVLIAIGVFGGVKLDKWLNTSPLFTLICSLSAIAIALYLMLKGVVKSSKTNKDESKDTH